MVDYLTVEPLGKDNEGHVTRRDTSLSSQYGSYKDSLEKYLMDNKENYVTLDSHINTNTSLLDALTGTSDTKVKSNLGQLSLHNDALVKGKNSCELNHEVVSAVYNDLNATLNYLDYLDNLIQHSTATPSSAQVTVTTTTTNSSDS